MKKFKKTFTCVIMLFCMTYSSFAQKVEYVKISREGGQIVTIKDSSYIGYEDVTQVYKQEGNNHILYLTAKGEGINAATHYMYTLFLNLDSPQNELLKFDGPELLEHHFQLDRQVRTALNHKQFEGKRVSEFTTTSSTDKKEHLLKLTAEWKFDSPFDGSIVFSAEVIK